MCIYEQGANVLQGQTISQASIEAVVKKDRCKKIQKGGTVFGDLVI